MMDTPKFGTYEDFRDWMIRYKGDPEPIMRNVDPSWLLRFASEGVDGKLNAPKNN